MGHVGLKTRLLDQIIEKPCVHNRGFIFSRMFTKVCQNVCFFLPVLRPSSNMGHFWQKARSVGVIKEKPYAHTIGFIFH